MNSQTFARNVLKIAKDKNIPISEIELQIGCSSGYISRATRGKKLSLDFALAISEYLNMDLFELLNEKLIILEQINIKKKELEKLEKELENYGGRKNV